MFSVRFLVYTIWLVASTDLLAQESPWSSFRGPGGTGIADGFSVPTHWDATDPDDQAIIWQTDVPGLGHSSPTLWGDRIFVATAIASSGQAPLKVGRGGEPTAADDNETQRWVILCYSRKDGVLIWEQTVHSGVPRATRHAKATHANTSVAINADRLVACFGSEGVFCLDHNGQVLWKKDLGVVDVSKYGIGWGYASSPALHGDRVALVCDDPDHPFVCVLSLEDGREIWRRSRDEVCERSWGTPLIHATDEEGQVVVNGWPWIVSYDLVSGEERWRIEGGGDNPVPTPFVSGDSIFITNSHGGESPIFAIRPEARGTLTPSSEAAAEGVIWSTRRGGSYMSTPVVYRGQLYLGNTNGILRSFDAASGEEIYEERLAGGAAIYASLVAADGKIYCASEDGIVYVVRAGREFELLAENRMGAPCFATPAIADGFIYVRTTERLLVIGGD